MALYIATESELTSVADAIRTKGGTSSPLVFPAGFVSAIEDIPAGGTTVEPSDVNFFDYDGALVDSYTAEEFAALSALPANPSHEGLTAQGWNWSLSDAQTYVASYGKLDIGQMYITDDGKTRIHIKLEDGRLAPYLGIAVDGSADVDWGDGSTHDTVTGTSTSTAIKTKHTYAEAGEYVIAIDVTGSAALPGNSMTTSDLLTNDKNSSDENFVYMTAVKAIEIGSDMDISGYALNNCFSLSQITIPHGVTSIGKYAFQKCYSLTFVILPDSITEISINTFSNCTRLSKAVIPNSITTIGNNAFGGCYYLQNAMLTSGMENIGTDVFSSNYALQEIIIPSGIESIPNKMFSDCQTLSFIKLPDSVTSIGQSSFGNCCSLVELMIPANVTSIAQKAFGANSYGQGSCKGLASIIFKPTTPATVAASNAFVITTGCILYVPFSALATYLSAANYPAPATYTYMGFATYNSGETLPTQDSTEAYNVTWYATKADALAQTNPITEGTGSEIYCRYAAA